MRYTNKLTIRELGISIEETRKAVEGTNKSVPIARFVGELSKFKVSDRSAHGPCVVFGGLIEGTNLLNGEIVRSDSLILPEIISPAFESQLASAQEKDKKAKVAVAVDIYATAANSSVGYKMSAESLLTGETVDPLSAIKEGLPPLPKFVSSAIEAPKTPKGAKTAKA